ncbi:MAG: transposase [Planctomycetota bacterium]
MTNCNTGPLLFSSLGRKKIQGDFNGGSLTSDAGALLLREVDKRLGLVNALFNKEPTV